MAWQSWPIVRAVDIGSLPAPIPDQADIWGRGGALLEMHEVCPPNINWCIKREQLTAVTSSDISVAFPLLLYGQTG